MNHLFRFSISPVQSFIEQARKAQDLYAGSRILSKLAQEAAKEAERQGIELVFPQLNDQLQSFPNRLTGILRGNSGKEELQAKGQAIEDKVRKEFKDIAEKALEKAGYKDNPPDGFGRQVGSHLDINWLFYPYENDYPEAFEASDQLMAALKNTRFIGNPNPEEGRKCSLDGERNALFRHPDTKNKQLKEQAVEIKGSIWLDINEGLSAVSLMKRAFEEDQENRKFPSTSKVALQKQIEQLKKAKPGLLECYEKLFSNQYPEACAKLLIDGYLGKINTENKKKNWSTNFDEQLLYEENLTDKNIQHPTQLDIAKKVQQQLKPYLTYKYYALICFDVDKMGELLSKSDAQAQQNTSEKLMAFSRHIYDTLNGKKLHVVYAGGDDFLGFINLSDLFGVVKTLRIEFDKQVSQVLGEDLTFSMGIAIAHYKTPLHIVLQTARAMQKAAKDENKGDRDAVAIKVLKHSGEGHETYFNWNLENGKLLQWDALQELAERLLEDCSDTFIRSLEREFSSLQDKDGNMIDAPGQIKYEAAAETGGIMQFTTHTQGIQMLKTELLRLAHRSLKEGQKDKNQGVKLRDAVWTLFETEDKITHQEVAFKNALEALKIATFIHRKTKEKNR